MKALGRCLKLEWELEIVTENNKVAEVLSALDPASVQGIDWRIR